MKRFPAYKMTDGVTPLSEGYFNPLLADIDARLDALEALRAAMDVAISRLVENGLTRLNAILLPLIDDARASLSQLMVETRGEVDTLVASLDQDVSTAQEAIAALQAAFAAIDIQGALDAALDGVSLPSLARADVVAYSYDVSGRLVGVEESTPLGARVTAISYDASGRVATLQVDQGGRRRLEDVSYDAHGRVAIIAAMETTV